VSFLLIKKNLLKAKTPEDGEEGLLFMQEMIELSKHQTTLPATQAKVVRYGIGKNAKMIFAGPAQFGKELSDGFSVRGQLVVADPIKACSTPANAKEFWAKIVLVERGDCMFVGNLVFVASMWAEILIRAIFRRQGTNIGEVWCKGWHSDGQHKGNHRHQQSAFLNVGSIARQKVVRFLITIAI